MLWLKLRRIRSADPRTRRDSIQALADCSTLPNVVNMIANLALQDADATVRECAGSQLVQWGSVSIPPVVSAVQRGHREVASRALELLCRIDKAQTRELCIAKLASSTGLVIDPLRKDVVTILGTLGGRESISALVESVRDKDKELKFDWEYWKAVAKALAAIGDDAVEPLCAALSGSVVLRRKAAAAALAEIGNVRALEPLLAGLAAKRDHVIAEAIAKLVAKSHQSLPEEKVVVALMASLAEDDPTRSYRASALALLRKLKGAASTRALEQCLQHKDRSVAQTAAAELKSRGFVPSDTGTRIAFALAQGDWASLAAIGAPAIPTLAREAANSNDALRTLVQVGDPSCVDSIVVLLSTGNTDRKIAAAQALGELSDSRAIEPLLAALDAYDSAVRKSAADALGDLGAVNALPVLRGRATVRVDGHSQDRDARDAVMTEIYVKSIARIIERSAKDVGLAELKALANLSDVEQVQFKCNEGCEIVYLAGRRLVDCSLVKQLARQELIRRGAGE